MNNIFVYILTLFLFGSSNSLQQFFNTHNRQQFLTTMINDEGLGEVVSAVKNQLAEKHQEPFNDAAEELNSIIQIPISNIFGTMRENNTREYRTSDLPANVTSVLELFDNATTATTVMWLGFIVYKAVKFIYLLIYLLFYLPSWAHQASARTGTIDWEFRYTGIRSHSLSLCCCGSSHLSDQ